MIHKHPNPRKGENWNRIKNEECKTNFLSHTAVGSAHELLVCADLLERGYHVYRSVSHAAVVDLVAIHNDRRESPILVEVTTDNADHIRYDKRRKDDLVVTLALVNRDSGRVEYRPTLPETWVPAREIRCPRRMGHKCDSGYSSECKEKNFGRMFCGCYCHIDSREEFVSNGGAYQKFVLGMTIEERRAFMATHGQDAYLNPRVPIVDKR